MAREIAYKALLTGGSEAHYHGDCERPRIVEMRGTGPLLMKRLAALDEDPFIDWAEGYGFLPGRAIHGTDMRPEVLTVAAKVRCRRCGTCLKARSRLWTARALVECGQHARTWFGTLTVAPERRFWARLKAEQTLLAGGWEPWEALTSTERLRAIERELSPEVTRWLKRVRKASSASLRYLLVVEAHKDGFPHYHCLVHEAQGTVTKRHLQEQWRYGFSKWNLVEGHKPAYYVCKYLNKSAQTRVRASRRYGQF